MVPLIPNWIFTYTFKIKNRASNDRVTIGEHPKVACIIKALVKELMEYKIRPIEKYNYSFDARTGAPSQIQLWGNGSKVADIRFVDDDALVPEPTFTPSFNDVKLFFKSSELLDLVHKLRHENNLGLIMIEDGPVSISKIQGLADSMVVCSNCSPDLLEAKTTGINEAMDRMVNFCGADILPIHCPVTFHLSGDGYCGPYTSGTTGHASIDESKQGHLCLFDVEKENRSLPFTVENAQKIEDQLLAVHEAMHIWFRGRNENYLIQEPFCKMVSFIISEATFGPDYCSRFSNTPNDHPDVLMRYLCEMGLTNQLTSEILKQLAYSASHIGRALSDLEFANLVSTVLEQDSIPAFQASGILP